MASPPQQKRCLYEILGLCRECSPDEIRSAYRKLALQRHPDKLVRTGVSEADATAQFQELANAFEILSDARERAWYDSHRSQILSSNSESPASSSSSSPVIVPELFRYFSSSVFSGYSDSGKGFYAVYGAVFNRVHQTEVSFAKKNGFSLPKEAPLFGNLECHYSQVTDFYDHWLGFATVMDEEENGKLRKKACREYNETVRGLTVFVKKRDKRVIDMTREMEKKKEMEKEKKKEMEKLHKFYDKYRQFKI